MAKKYKGSLTLDWFNKQKSVLSISEGGLKAENDTPAPKINWVNKEEALFYEIFEKEGKGNIPFWVNREDIRVKEARPLIFQSAYNYENGEFSKTEDENKATDITNILIQGDNLLALNTLKKHFARLPKEEKIKCIYIDPPYNTGSAFNHYEDNLVHSEWLTLMRDRLVGLRELMREDGTIWISIDGDESHYLKVLCDDIFGRSNFIEEVVWQRTYAPINLKKTFSRSHDYILVYARNMEILQELNKLPRSEQANSLYKNPDNDPRGPWQSDNFSVGPVVKEKLYKIITPGGREIFPPAGRCWLLTEKRFEEFKADNRIWFGSDGNNVPRIKRFLSEVKDGVTPMTLWTYKEVGHNQDAKKEVKKVNPDDVFDTPKPERLIERIITIATDEGDRVLDIFGGSGTTLAVAHKMKRKWVGVEIGGHAESHIIPRLLGVIKGEDQIGITESVGWKGGGGFSYYKLGESIIQVDTETGKGEFNWSLGKKFIQDSLLISYDFILDEGIVVGDMALFEKNTISSAGRLTGANGKSIYGIADLAAPEENDLSITNDQLRAVYDSLKSLPDFHSLVIYTNKGIDIAQDSIPDDLEIIKVPHAIFAELER